ncbi:integrase catalytic domain-containing protein [Trichonephila clavipes]|uniref:Integrase catalytic domain-containing protein n=1 Tax=Trichonephila clavipes TaxID=2585209 RepID=A0A8X6S6U1_TRICX|nr:integrase catalytic domain-containing protein [Trichonephila clavipes]
MDIKYVAAEIGEEISWNIKIVGLKDLILNSIEYKKDPEFVQEHLRNVVSERKLQETEKDKKEKEHELEIRKLEAVKELELTRIQFQNKSESFSSNSTADLNNSKRKFTLPRLKLRQFGDNIKDWLPFWSQFEQIHKDEDIAPEDKFRYLVQATVSSSRAREIVGSFPPTGAICQRAIESSQSCFGREDILVEMYVREFLKLILSVQTKEKLSLTSLYDKLESHLRALETLGVTTDKCASILYPMVESCFAADFFKGLELK